jgi:hypothetical protein
MHDERVCAIQENVVTVTCIKRHQCFATTNLLWPTWENISKLEDSSIGNRIETMVAIDLTSQAPLGSARPPATRDERHVVEATITPASSSCEAAPIRRPFR